MGQVEQKMTVIRESKMLSLLTHTNCVERKKVLLKHAICLTILTSTADARQSILGQILTPEAAERLGRIRLVKESRATEIENRLIMLARSGQLRERVTEAQLRELLNAVAEKKDEEKIIVNRRKATIWDDDDDLADL
jgi:programmed cell death protein 5